MSRTKRPGSGFVGVSRPGGPGFVWRGIRSGGPRAGKIGGIEEVPAVTAMLLEPLQPGEIDLAAELDGVGAIRDRDVVLDQRLVLMIVLDEFQSSKDDLLGVSYIRTSVGRRRASGDRDAAWRRGSAHDW